VTSSTQPVPGGWREFKLGDLLRFSNGINADKSFYGAGVPFANVLEIINNESLEENDVPGRIDLPRKTLARYEVRRGDLLFNRTSETQEEVGLTSVYLGSRPIVYGGFVFRGRSLTNHLDLSYSKYALRATAVRDQITACGQGGIRANIGQRDLKTVMVALPVIPEQRVIAEVLDDASKQIELLECLIAKKRAIKQGMMQQRFALPGGGGSQAQLGTLVAFLSGGTPDRSKTDYWSGRIPWISATTLKDIEVSTSDQSVTERGVRAGSRMAPLSSTLVLVRGSALHSEIRASLVAAPVCFNQDVKALVPSARVEPKFLTYSIHANTSRLLPRVTSAGNTAGVLDTKILKAFEIWLPDRDTQRRVISVFDDITRELEILAARLEKAKAIKQGMMQQLLTGRIRLPVQEAAA
jgi:type I restriction enzyme, S subunit